MLLDIKRPEEAEKLFADMVPRLDRVMPEGHWIMGLARVNQGEALMDLKRFDEAEPLMLEGYNKLTASLDPEHPRVRGAAGSIANLYKAWGKADEESKWCALGPPPPPEAPTTAPATR
jgi:hypothetical protein